MGKSRSNKNRQPSRKEARERKKLEDRAEREFTQGMGKSNSRAQMLITRGGGKHG